MFFHFLLHGDGISPANLYQGGLWAHIRLVCCEMHQLWFNLRIRSLWKAKPFPAGAALLKDIKTWCETLMRRQAGRQRPIARALSEQWTTSEGSYLFSFSKRQHAVCKNAPSNSSSALNVVPTNLPAQSTMTQNALVTANFNPRFHAREGVRDRIWASLHNVYIGSCSPPTSQLVNTKVPSAAWLPERGESLRVALLNKH